MNRQRLTALAVLGILAVLTLTGARDADAIPAFARKYKFSCSTCHAPAPRLKPFGEEFAARGFRLEDPSQEPTRATVETGDPMLQLLRELPVAVRMDLWASYKEDSSAEADLEWPWSFKILSGAAISPKVSYYVYGILEQGESVKLEDTYLQFHAVAGVPVDVILGQFQVCDPMFKREIRLERLDYEVFKVRVGHVPTNLTYDRGLLVGWGAPGDVDVIAQVVNGNGIEPAEHDTFDDNTFKNVSLRLARSFGPVRLGLFGYRGKTTAETGENVVTYFGPDVVADLGETWQLNLQYLRRTDDNPYLGVYTGPDYVTEGGFAELHFLPRGPDGRWVVSALYNKVDSDDPLARRESGALTANYLLARNIRMTAEVARDLEAERTRFSLGVMAAF